MRHQNISSLIAGALILVCAGTCISVPINGSVQSRAARTQGKDEKVEKNRPGQPDNVPVRPVDDSEEETLKIDTDLVTVPVIATDAKGLYVSDLSQNEFTISEDDVKQEIAFFATVNVPFHVVLLLDTSASTQEKLSLIRQAAIAFVEQLQNVDRVKVISFDDQVRDLNDFTNDRNALKAAIYKTTSGQGTKLYDALEKALSSVRLIKGRKAIVLFSDGVDYHSDAATFDGTLRWLDEEEVVVYPIRYNTREETERIARDQSGQSSQLPTLGSIRNTPPGTTPPTFPSEDPNPVPTTGTQSKTGPFGLPLPDDILRRRRETEREREISRIPPDRLPAPNPHPPTSDRNDPFPDRQGDPRSIPGSNRDSTSGRMPGPSDDSISLMLDHLYSTADQYLNSLADKTGGRVLRADTIASLPDAFSRIATELRTQYAIGYYPTNKTRDQAYRRIKVKSTRKAVLIRARPGYSSTARN